MADSLSISPVALFGPAGISPIASTLAVTARFAVDSSLFADERSVVDLSTEGQLLSALSTFRASLLPQPEATLATTDNDQATAQNLVNAFNTLLDSIITLPSGTTPPTADDIAEQLTATVSALATTPIAADDGATLTLPAIGIAPSASGPALQLDQAQLATAIASAPAATQAVLADTTEAFAAFAVTAESQLASATTPPLPPGDLNLLGTATPLPADTNDLLTLTQPPATAPTPLPIVGAEGPSSEIILPTDEALRTAVQATELDSAAETATAVAGSPAAERSVASATPDLARPTTVLPNNAPTTAGITPPPATAPVAPGPAPASTDTLAAEQRSTTAGLTLQTRLADPRLRAINNQSDPAYAAVIAASHLSDFDSLRPFTDPRALATDTVGPVSALVRAQAIADYREAAGEAGRRTLIGTSTAHQWL